MTIASYVFAMTELERGERAETTASYVRRSQHVQRGPLRQQPSPHVAVGLDGVELLRAANLGVAKAAKIPLVDHAAPDVVVVQSPGILLRDEQIEDVRLIGV